jgi:hypothetical protein
MQVEHEYFRCGAWTYIAGPDVHHARIFGRSEEHNGIEPFDRLVEQVMTRPPYNDARRVFWIVDNCSVTTAPGPYNACKARIRNWSWFTRRSMPVGEIKWRSTSPFSNERF